MIRTQPTLLIYSGLIESSRTFWELLRGERLLTSTVHSENFSSVKVRSIQCFSGLRSKGGKGDEEAASYTLGRDQRGGSTVKNRLPDRET